MKIGLVYSKADPGQSETCEFVERYVRERGILARIVRRDQPVKSISVTIDGHCFTERRRKPRTEGSTAFPGKDDIAYLIEKQTWRL